MAFGLLFYSLIRRARASARLASLALARAGPQWPNGLRPSFLFPHTPGAGIRPLGFARIGSRGLNGPMAFGHAGRAACAGRFLLSALPLVPFVTPAKAGVPFGFLN